MNPQLLIPKNKGDVATAAQLKHYTYQELKSIIPDLLKWLQDCNWPVSYPVSQYLTSICNDISAEIMEAFRQGDVIWNYWLLQNFGLITQDPAFQKEIFHLAKKPTTEEMNEGLDEMAREILENRWAI